MKIEKVKFNNEEFDIITELDEEEKDDLILDMEDTMELSNILEQTNVLEFGDLNE